jgi:hypothetical protein
VDRGPRAFAGVTVFQEEQDPPCRGTHCKTAPTSNRGLLAFIWRVFQHPARAIQMRISLVRRGTMYASSSSKNRQLVFGWDPEASPAGAK